jgi:hypothetical protein
VPIHVRTLYFAKRNDDGGGICGMWRWIGRLLDFPPSWYAAGDHKDDEKKIN